MRKKITEKAIHIIAAIIAIMFFYAIAVKMSDYTEALADMHKQIFSKEVATILTWFLPLIQLIIIVLLLWRPYITAGLWCSLTLLLIFSFYIILALGEYFDDKPCSCGGILGRESSFTDQLWFNIVFILLAILGLWLIYKPRPIQFIKRLLKKEKRYIG